LLGEETGLAAFTQRSIDVKILTSNAFFLGAAVRELDLALLNKADVLREKKTKKVARAGGKMRRNATSPETDARSAEMMRMIAAGQTIAGAARHMAKKRWRHG
jgi:hypothetical protein